jgi:drug/metabolite transporter (DMT)-like permease
LRAQLALVGIAAVWGLTFVMVQDAIAVLPTMAFLAYRFGSAAVLVAVIFRHRLCELDAAGWRAGGLMGAFLCAGYVFQTLGLEHTSASNAGFITGLMVVFTPVLGAVFLGQRLPAIAWAAAAVSAAGPTCCPARAAAWSCAATASCCCARSRSPPTSWSPTVPWATTMSAPSSSSS